MINFTVLVGGYTGGIYSQTRGQLSVLLADLPKVSYMVMGTNGCLYAVSEPAGGSGMVFAYRMGEDGMLSPICHLASPSGGLCHLALDEDCRMLTTVSYHSGTVQSYPLLPDGSIGPLAFQQQHQGGGPRTEQEAAHPHQLVFSPEGGLAFVCDLGCDCLHTYRPDYTTGSLIPLPRMSLALPSGCGPRHMVFHPAGHTAYLLAELTSQVFTLSYSATHGLSILDVKQLPQQQRWDAGGSAIRISPDGRHLYAANRRDDTLSLLDLADPSRPVVVEQYPCGGVHPRDFQLIGEHLLLCAHMESDSLTWFGRDTASGVLTQAETVTAPRPACVNVVR